jgi:hypothetical protein
VETDNPSPTAASDQALPAPTGELRTAHAPHAERPPGSGDEHSFGLAAEKIVPREWWKYAAVGLASLTVTSGFLIAGWRASDLAAALGAGIEGLVAFPTAPAAKWFSSMLLSLAGQLALLIWWARSQSHEDFEGRYWFWIRATCVWFILSACIATDLHRVAGETLQHFWPEISVRSATLGWLVPAWGMGAVILPLAREMRGCRWSRSLFILGAACYLAAAGLHVALDTVVPPSVRPLVIEAGLLAGHQCLFFSMWLHARHVLHFTVDPAISSKSRWNISRPHFKLPRLGLKRKVKQDSRQVPPRQPSCETTTPAPPVQRAPARTAPAPKPPVPKPAVETEPIPRAALPALVEEPPVPELAVSTERAGDDEEPEQVPSKPDLRGLSKKQRRRLMQELREKERASER